MRPTGKILIIDDDPSFLKVYENRLGAEGYLVETATTVSEALAKLDQPGWDVVLLDQKLQGPGDADSGLDLLSEIAMRAPRAKTILVTGYASDEAITRAFREGVYDYLEKNSVFRVLLLAKLRNAVEAVRAQRFGELNSEETEAAIRETWSAVEAEADANRKGKLLEDLMVLLFKTIPGFHQATPRRRNDVEEIDIVIRNESTDPLWVNDGTPYILVECKNWSKPVGAGEIRTFFGKLERRFGRCRLGFFVAPGGFTGPFQDDLRTERKGNILVIPVDREALRGIVLSTDRNATLKKLHERAVIEQNGH
jgi:ActR/RegA family two-component response regulator